MNEQEKASVDPTRKDGFHAPWEKSFVELVGGDRRRNN